jgi:sensory rhodopsin
LQSEGASLTGDESEAFQKIKNLILIGWIIYPLGYLAPAVSADLMDLRELLYTIADIINKVGLGVLVLNMAKIKSGEKV